MRRNCERRPSPVLFSSLLLLKELVYKLLKCHNKIGQRKEIAYYLEALFEDGDPTLVPGAPGDIARACLKFAQTAGLGRRASTRHFRPRGTRNSPQCRR